MRGKKSRHETRFFRLIGEKNTERLDPKAVRVEEELHPLLNERLPDLLDVRFVAKKFKLALLDQNAPKKEADVVGLDKNNRPVIIEYKRTDDDGVIKQALKYRNLLDEDVNRDAFEECARRKFEKPGQPPLGRIHWRMIRIICLAYKFDREDEDMARNNEDYLQLIRYRLFGQNEILMLEWAQGEPPKLDSPSPVARTQARESNHKSHADYMADANGEQKERFDSLCSFLLGLGGDVRPAPQLNQHAFKSGNKHIANLQLRNQENKVLIYLTFPSSEIRNVEGFARDMEKINHWGGGNFELTVRSMDDIERAKPYMHRAYEYVSQKKHESQNRTEGKIAPIEMDTERDAASSELRDLYDDLRTYILNLGAQERENKREALFSRSHDFTGQGRFASIAFRPKLTQLGGRSAPDHVRVYLYTDASKLQKEMSEGVIQLMKKKPPRIRIYNRADLERAKPPLRRVYEEAGR